MTTLGAAPLRRVALVLLAVSAYGAWAAWDVTRDGLVGPHRSSLNVYFHLFATLEPVALVALALAALGLLVALRGQATATGADAASAASGASEALPAATAGAIPPAWRARWPLAFAVVTMLVAFAIQQLALHGFPLSMDEFNTGFEAAIIRGGHLFQPVRDEWIAFVPAIKPVFVAWRAEELSWYSGYIPVYATLRAAFDAVSLGAWLNPLCAGASVLLVVALARRLRPGNDVAPVVAALTLVTSAQFLVTSGSQYTMPAHLLANLAWTWLALRDDRASVAGAALLGGLALGLHNPFPHALFALPFFWRWLMRREFARFALTAVVYLAFAAVWLAWLRMERGGEPGQGGGFLSLFAIPGIEGWRLAGMNLVLIFSWQAPATAALLVLAFLGERGLGDEEKALARGVVLTFLFYVLYGSTQGHGWGYRYHYAVLGSVALLVGAASTWLPAALDAARTRMLLRVGFGAALLLVPLRLVGVERFVGPFAQASAWLARIDADVVAVESGAVWYGRDLVRNDAALSRPVIVNGSMLNGAGWNALRERHGTRLVLLPADSLVAHGMQRLPPRVR